MNLVGDGENGMLQSLCPFRPLRAVEGACQRPFLVACKVRE
jgi:hypothetical protein